MEAEPRVSGDGTVGVVERDVARPHRSGGDRRDGRPGDGGRGPGQAACGDDDGRDAPVRENSTVGALHQAIASSVDRAASPER